jgi:hypothetical protein
MLLRKAAQRFFMPPCKPWESVNIIANGRISQLSCIAPACAFPRQGSRRAACALWLCGLFISRLAPILSLVVYYTKLKPGDGSSAHHVALLAPVAPTPHASVGPTAEELGSGGADPLRTPAAPASPVPAPQRPVQCHAGTETPSGAVVRPRSHPGRPSTKRTKVKEKADLEGPPCLVLL